jgi:gas vesicle protein
MAIAAEKSPAIAEALARQMNRSQDEIRKAQEEVKQAHKESAERAERMGREGLEAAKEIGKHIAPTSNQQIIK